jgi:hypothetical protein
MNHKAFASKLYYRLCCCLFFFVAAAASFNGYYDKWRLLDTTQDGLLRGRNTFEPMMDGTAERPFVYRQLLPMLANFGDRQISELTKDRLFSENRHIGLLRIVLQINSPVTQDRAYFLRYWIIYGLDFLFAWGAVYAMYLLGKSAGFAAPTAAASAVLMILLIPYFMNMGGYFYDYPELAFLALTAWMALSFDWWWMIPVVALAALNKESFLFFIPTLYPLLRQRSSRINALVGTGVLGLICAAVYCALRVRFQLNPGVTAENNILQQFQFMLHLQNWVFPQKMYGTVFLPIYNPLSLALIAWTLWRCWRSLPRAIQRHMQIAAIINFPLFLLFGFPGEVRGLSLLYVTLLLLLAASLTEWTSGQTRTST